MASNLAGGLGAVELHIGCIEVEISAFVGGKAGARCFPLVGTSVTPIVEADDTDAQGETGTISLTMKI